MGGSTSKPTKEAAAKEEPKEVGTAPSAAPEAEKPAAAAEAPEKASTKGEQESKDLVLLEKQSPAVPTWKKRYFTIDTTRGALVYYERPAAPMGFKGAIPLSLITAVKANHAKRTLVVEIPERCFSLRLPREAKTADELKALTKRLLDALAAEPEPTADPKAAEAPLPARHWKQQARYTSTPPREEGNVRSRAVHSGYPERAKLISGTQSWDVALPTYAPPRHTAPGVTEQPAAEGFVSWTGAVRFGEGKPLNPSGRTGLAGQGELPRAGPNQELRAIVTREEGGSMYVVVVRKSAGGEWTLPGGFLPPTAAGERLPTAKTMRHAFALQAAAAGSDRNGPRLDAIFTDAAAKPATPPAGESTAEAPVAEGESKGEGPAWLIHAGYCDHSVNTDNAWLESAAGHFHCGAQEGADLLLGEGKGLHDARWIKVPMGAAAGSAQGHWSDLRPAHRQWVRTALLRRGALAEA